MVINNKYRFAWYLEYHIRHGDDITGAGLDIGSTSARIVIRDKARYHYHSASTINVMCTLYPDIEYPNAH